MREQRRLLFLTMVVSVLNVIVCLINCYFSFIG